MGALRKYVGIKNKFLFHSLFAWDHLNNMYSPRNNFVMKLALKMYW